MVVRLCCGYTGCSCVAGVVAVLLDRGRVGERGRNRERGREIPIFIRIFFYLMMIKLFNS